MSVGWVPRGQRIPPLEAVQGDDEPTPRPLHILTTLAHHPELLEAFVAFASTLTLRGRLSRRDAELASLRASWNCRSDFEWGHHRLYALAAGLSEEEIARVAEGPGAAGWSEAEAAVLRAADELHAERTIREETWHALSAHFDEAQRIELLFTVGQYTTLSCITNALAIPLEPHLPGLPAR